jgi:hypothetical protein
LRTTNPLAVLNFAVPFMPNLAVPVMRHELGMLCLFLKIGDNPRAALKISRPMLFRKSRAQPCDGAVLVAARLTELHMGSPCIEGVYIRGVGVWDVFWRDSDACGAAFEAFETYARRELKRCFLPGYDAPPCVFRHFARPSFSDIPVPRVCVQTCTKLEYARASIAGTCRVYRVNVRDFTEWRSGFDRVHLKRDRYSSA